MSQGTITGARFALGGVGTRPGASPRPSAACSGRRPEEALFRQAADLALAGAAAAEPERLQGRARQALPRPRAEAGHALIASEVQMSAGPRAAADDRHRQSTRRASTGRSRSPATAQYAADFTPSRHALRRAGRRHHRQRHRDGDRRRASREQMPGVRAVFKRGRLSARCRASRPASPSSHFMDESTAALRRRHGPLLRPVRGPRRRRHVRAGEGGGRRGARHLRGRYAQRRSAPGRREDQGEERARRRRCGLCRCRGHDRRTLRDRAGDPQPDRDPRHGRGLGRRRADAL